MTTAQYQLKTEKRTLFGKKTKQLRLKGVTPANISGNVDKPVAVTVPTKAFVKMFAEAGETSVIYLQVEGEKQERPTLVDSVDFESMTGQLLHVSFRQVDLKQKVKATVQIDLIGELTVDEAVVAQLVHEIEVEALPTDLPEKLEIDLASFTEVGQSFTIAQLKLDPSKVTTDVEPETEIVQIQKLELMAEEPVEAPVAEGEAPAEGAEAAPAEGAAPEAAKAEDKKAE